MAPIFEPRLGCAGWPDLKSAFAEELGLHGERYGQRAKSLAGRGQGADLVGEMFEAQRRNLDLTSAHCGKPLHDAVKMLRRAKTVYIAGFAPASPARIRWPTATGSLAIRCN